MAPRKKKADDVTAVAIETKVTSIKGFDKDLKCRDFQFEVGKTYEVAGEIMACKNGFHAVPDDNHPLNVFSYYPPTGARFAVVTQDGASNKDVDKLASAKITIDCEISLGDLTKRAIDWVFKRAKWSEGQVATKDNEGASANGDLDAFDISAIRNAIGARIAALRSQSINAA